MKKNLFILLILFFLNTVSAMEESAWRSRERQVSKEPREKEKETISVPRYIDVDTKGTIEVLSELLEKNPTDHPKGLIKSYLINNYSLVNIAQIFVKMHQAKDHYLASENIKYLGELICNACSDLFGTKAVLMSGLYSSSVANNNSKKFSFNPTPQLRYTTFKSLSKDRSEDWKELTQDCEKACMVLDALNLSKGPSEDVAQTLMALSISPQKNSISEEVNRRHEREWRVMKYMKYLSDTTGIVVGTSDGKIISITIPEEFDAKMKMNQTGLPVHKGAVTALDSCGKFIISGGVDKTVRLFDLQMSIENPPLLFGRHVDHITAVAFPHCDGEKFFSSSKDKTIIHWDLENQAFIDAMPHSDPVSHIVVSPNNCEVASCSGKDLLFWDPRAKKYSDIVNCDYPICGSAYFPHGSQIGIIGKGANGVIFYDKIAGKIYKSYLLSNAALKREYNDTDKSVIRFSSCGTKVLLGFSSLCQMFDLLGKDDDIHMHKLSLPDYNCLDCSFSPDGDEIAVLHADDHHRSTLTRYQLNKKNNKKLGKGLTASRALALKFLEKAEIMNEEITIDNEVAQRMFSPEVQKSLPSWNS